jgi:hypothetical protein
MIRTETIGGPSLLLGAYPSGVEMGVRVYSGSSHNHA